MLTLINVTISGFIQGLPYVPYSFSADVITTLTSGAVRTKKNPIWPPSTFLRRPQV